MGKYLIWVLRISVYFYLLSILIVLVILKLTGDHWWFGTVLLYGPRWIYFLPVILLMPLALIWQRHLIWPLALVSALVFIPIMGLNIAIPNFSKETKRELRLVTYNVQRWEVSGEEYADLLENLKPDFSVIQECASPRRFKRQLPADWFIHSAGYNILISRYPLSRCEISKRGLAVNGIYCVAETPVGPIGVANVDMLTPRRALDAILDRDLIFDLTQIEYTQKRIEQRWEESAKLAGWIKSFPEENKLIAGDFNLTADSPIYRDIWTEFRNAYSHTTFGYGHTKRTKINIFNYTARIDHILSTNRLKPLRSWTGPDYGADHLPLIADFILQ